MHMTKFDSQATESLYRQEPDDSYGVSLDGFSWYGLYRTSEEESGGFILQETTQGFVTRFDFETDSELEEIWAQIITEPDYYEYVEGSF